MVFKKFFGNTLTLILLLLFLTDIAFAGKAHDQYGFGQSSYLIQSALEAGKSTKGIWDLKGTKDFFKTNKWKEVQVWERDKGKDREDRLFVFKPAGGSAVGRYFIKYEKQIHWGINVIDANNKVEARSRADNFELKYVGTGRWKIYYKPGWILSLQKPTAENGTKIVLTRDHNGKHGQWVFYNAKTNKSFVPKHPATEAGKHDVKKQQVKTSFDTALGSKHSKSGYFSHVSANQFRKDNMGNKMKEFYDELPPSKQWDHVLETINATENNKNTAARRAIYKALKDVSIKRGSNFAEKMMQPQVKEMIAKKTRGEKDSQCKNFLKTITDNF